MWRSKKSRCESVLTQRIIPPDTWTHVSIVFSPSDSDVNREDFGGFVALLSHVVDLVYPMIIEIYVNGELILSKQSIRFLSVLTSKTTKA